MELDKNDFENAFKGCDFKWADTPEDENPPVHIELVGFKKKMVVKKITVGDEVQYERK